MFWGLHCGSQEMLQVPVLVCHGVKAISVALFANRCVYKSKTCENEQGSLERFPQSSPFCYHFLMPNLSAIKSDKSFLWNWGSSTLLCGLNFPEGQSGREKGDVVKRPFPAVWIGSNTNPFRMSLSSLRRTLYAWCEEIKSFVFLLNFLRVSALSCSTFSVD